MQPDKIMILGELLEIRIGEDTVRTKLLEIVSDREFIILQPTVKGIPVRADNEDVPFTFYRPNGCYRFSARIYPPFHKGSLLLCRAEQVSEIKRIQRRQYYRLPVVLDAVMVGEEEGDGKTPRRYKCKTIDLSERSVALSCFESFEPDTPFKVEIKFSAVQTFSVRATVLRCIKPPRQTDPYEIILVFTEPYENAKMLRHYILMQQILEHKRNKHTDF